jgi:hypothetical protein
MFNVSTIHHQVGHKKEEDEFYSCSWLSDRYDVSILLYESAFITLYLTFTVGVMNICKNVERTSAATVDFFLVES